MTGKELADALFKALDEGTPGDDTGLVGEMVSVIETLDTNEMWRFVTAATMLNHGRTDQAPFRTFNAAAVKDDRFNAALKRMMAAQRPPELPQAP